MQKKKQKKGNTIKKFTTFLRMTERQKKKAVTVIKKNKTSQYGEGPNETM